MYQNYYSLFLEGHKDKIHMAGHSHHFWPDQAKIGHDKAFQMAMKHSDEKWDFAFTQLIPNVQRIISGHLNFSRPQDIAFAPNTHDLISKIISCFLFKKELSILTSTNEFHSVSRQVNRLQEETNISVNKISPSENLKEHLNNHSYDIIIFSHVFFDTGEVLHENKIKDIIENKKSAIFILDGYHHYCALPFDLSKFENDLYYMAGGYKYAQSGEGMCFMTIPKNCELRPLFTGWFASFKDLSSSQEGVNYENSGMRFWGSTIDLTPFYRFESVWSHFEKEGITVKDFHSYVRELQFDFLHENTLIKDFDISKHGHFITAHLDSSQDVNKLYEYLYKNNILTDFRGTSLRFGFTPYLTKLNIKKVKDSLKSFKL